MVTFTLHVSLPLILVILTLLRLGPHHIEWLRRNR